MRLVSRGYVDKQIAVELGIALQTVRSTLHTIFQRTGAQNRLSLLCHFYEIAEKANESAEPEAGEVAKYSNKLILESLKARARQILARAVRRGEIAKPEVCSQCGETRLLQGHHGDYAEPLKVEWLCLICHAARHRVAP